MATDPTQAKSAAKKDNAPTIEVTEDPASEAKPAPAKEAAKPAATKDEPKPVAANDAPKPAAAATTAKPVATKEESKPAPAPAAAKDEPKPAPAAAKETPKPAAQEAPRPAAPKPPPPVDTVSRVGRAEAIVRRNVLWSLGAGIIPFPVFDAVAITGVQLKMLAELSELYKVTFTESIAKKLVSSLLSSIGGVAIGTAVGSSLAKLIPGVGTALGIISVPLIGGAATHATGKVFIMHFEAGGTLLDFDPHKMRSYFKHEFEKAKQTVAEMNKNEQAKTNK